MALMSATPLLTALNGIRLIVVPLEFVITIWTDLKPVGAL